MQTKGENLSRLDAEMHDILFSKSITDGREKSQKYLQILRRYLRFKNLERQELLSDTVNTAENEDTLNPLSDETILTSLPKAAVRKARLLLQHWKSTAPHRIKWDNFGTVSIDNRVIPQSNIIDLLEDVVQSKTAEQQHEPIGSKFISNPIVLSLSKKFLSCFKKNTNK